MKEQEIVDYLVSVIPDNTHVDISFIEQSKLDYSSIKDKISGTFNEVKYWQKRGLKYLSLTVDINCTELTVPESIGLYKLILDFRSTCKLNLPEDVKLNIKLLRYDHSIHKSLLGLNINKLKTYSFNELVHEKKLRVKHLVANFCDLTGIIDWYYLESVVCPEYTRNLHTDKLICTGIWDDKVSDLCYTDVKQFKFGRCSQERLLEVSKNFPNLEKIKAFDIVNIDNLEPLINLTTLTTRHMSGKFFCNIKLDKLMIKNFVDLKNFTIEKGCFPRKLIRIGDTELRITNMCKSALATFYK